MEGITEIKRKDWSLVFNPEFGEYREKHRNIISRVKSVIEGAEVDGITSEMFALTPGGKSYFGVDLDGEQFFVKKIPNHTNQGGVQEFKSSERAKSLLKEHGIENVRVIDYIFAYSDSDYRYVVSRYENTLNRTLEDEMNRFDEARQYAEVGKLDVRYKELQSVLREFWDLTPRNMGYSEKTGEIVLFDLNILENGLSESPDDEL